MERAIVVGNTDSLILGKNPDRKYLLVVCTVNIVYLRFVEAATVANGLPLLVAGASWELPTVTLIAVKNLDPNHSFFQELHVIGSAAGSAIYVVEG